MDFYLLLGECSAYAGNRSDQTSNSRLDCAPLNSDHLQPRPVYTRSCGSQISGLAMKCQRGIHFYMEGYSFTWKGIYTHFYLKGYKPLLGGIYTSTWKSLGFRLCLYSRSKSSPHYN